MSKKTILFAIIILFISLGLFIFTKVQQKKDFLPDQKKQIILEKESKQKTITKVLEEEPGNEKESQFQTKLLGKMSLEELKRKGAKKKKEEFDLTPSLDDLIRMEKEKIKTY
jgi:cell division protein YceG involved in septum cleavage